MRELLQVSLEETFIPTDPKKQLDGLVDTDDTIAEDLYCFYCEKCDWALPRGIPE